MQFTKTHGCGNDFIIIDQEEGIDRQLVTIPFLQKWASKLCDRHRGVGADGILFVNSTEFNNLFYQMTVINSDGTIAEMCGNGLRCVAAYLYKRNRLQTGQNILTGAGEITVSFTQIPPLLLDRIDDKRLSHDMWVGASLGKPKNIHELKIQTQSTNLASADDTLTVLSLGNPHGVTFDPHAFEQRHVLAQEWSRHFKDGINLSFAKFVDKQQLELHVHERGCGWTQACGTGACATVVAAVTLGYAQQNQPIQVRLPGGDLHITYTSEGILEMWGPATEVYSGQIEIDRPKI